MIDVERTLAAGGAERIALLRYCVISITPAPIFMFLAQQYRLRPTHAGALALYDVFCEPQAPARLPDYELLPPRQLALLVAMAPIRAQWTQMQSPAEPDPETDIAIATPARHIFDTLVAGLRADASGRCASLAATFDPQLTADENLPGGRMSAAQRQFVDRVWVPIAKPRLVGAGFWQIANLA